MNRILSTLLLAATTTFAFSACTGQQTKKQETGNKVESVEQKEVSQAKVTELTKEEFKNRIMDFEANPKEWKYKGDKPAIIDFYATWCGPCKQTAPIVEELAKDYAGKIDVYKVDVDKQQELAAMFGIQSIPTFLFIPKEGQPQATMGAISKAKFEEIIKESLLKQNKNE